jgi:dTDP-4-amino-4,6-dideoxygalactose transaminase
MLFARCRFALHEGLRVLARERGLRRLWMPALLCCCVLEAAEAAGLEPLLYDVGSQLQPRLDTLAPAPGDGLLVVHYFGLLAPLDAAAAFCREHGLVLVEDCAHTLPDPASPVRAGSHGMVAVFSPRKQAPLPGGGVLVVNDPGLRRAVERPRAGFGDPRTLGRLALMLVERGAAALGCNGLRAKDHLPVIDVAREASERRRLAGREYGRPPRPPAWLAPLLQRIDWAGIIAARREVYGRLATALADVAAVDLPVPVAPAGSVPQMLPLRVADPARIARRLRRRGVEAMRWPGIEQFAFEHGPPAGVRDWLAHGLCLPLGYALTPRRLARIVDVVADAAGTAAGLTKPLTST